MKQIRSKSWRHKHNPDGSWKAAPKRARGKRHANSSLQLRKQELRDAALKSGCADCHTSSDWKYDYRVLSFDHVPERGTKEFGIGVSANNYRVPYSKFEAEMAKCDVVCENHHAVREHNRDKQRRSLS